MIHNNFILEVDRHSTVYICKACREPQPFSIKARQEEIDRVLAAHLETHTERILLAA